LAKIIWMCSCGMYWVWSEEDAKRHVNERIAEDHKIIATTISDEEWEKMKRDFCPSSKTM